MFNFIIGGFVPGTNIQLSFKAWLVSSCLFWSLAFYLWPARKDWLNKVKQPLYKPFWQIGSRYLRLRY